MVERKTYYCTECKGNHRHGKIWEDHKKYKLNKIDIPAPSNYLLQIDPYKLRPLALRQIGQLFLRMGGNGDRRMYMREINKVIIIESGGIDSPKQK